MRICLLSYRGNPYSGGQGVYVFHLARELCRLGHAIDVVVGRPYPRPLSRWARVHKVPNLNLWGRYDGDWLPRDRPFSLLSPANLFEFAATRLRFFPEPFTFSMRALLCMVGQLRHHGFDLIHDVQSLGYGTWAMKAFGAPVLTTVHHPLTVDRRHALARSRTLEERYHAAVFYPVAMQGWVIRRVDGVITASRAGRAAIAKDFRVPEGRIGVVPNGVDTERFRNPGGLRRRQSTLLFVGNTDDARKGAAILLQALARLPRRVKLRIVDEGYPARTLIPREVDRLGLTSRVIFTGRLSAGRLVEEYSRCTILVQPSLYEGFGLPAAEALACGTPVVATDAGAVAEVVSPESGLLVPPADAQALAEGIATLLEDPQRRQSMGLCGPSHIANHFAWPAAARAVVRVYRRALAGHPIGGEWSASV